MHLATPFAGDCWVRCKLANDDDVCMSAVLNKSAVLEGKLSNDCLEFNRDLLDALLQKDLREKVVILSSSNDLSVKPYHAQRYKPGQGSSEARGARLVLVSPTVRNETTHSCFEKITVESSASGAL